MGAAITVLSLAFSTFSQQLITFRVDQVLGGEDMQRQMGNVPRSAFVNNINGFSNSCTVPCLHLIFLLTISCHGSRLYISCVF